MCIALLGRVVLAIKPLPVLLVLADSTPGGNSKPDYQSLGVFRPSAGADGGLEQPAATDSELSGGEAEEVVGVVHGRLGNGGAGKQVS